MSRQTEHHQRKRTYMFEIWMLPELDTMELINREQLINFPSGSFSLFAKQILCRLRNLFVLEVDKYGAEIK